MTRLLGIAWVGLIICGCASRQTAESGGCCEGCSADEGYVSLFDGKTLNGWRNWKSQTISPGWAVQDGALARIADGAGNIITTGQYDDFDLQFEWKVAPKANSGIFFHVVETDDLGLITSPEYQILDNAEHPDGRNAKTTAASNYALHAPIRDVTRPVGEWNEGRIIVKDGHVEHWLNGTKVVEYQLDSPEWKQLVAASKFNQWPTYGTRRRGHIALQDHGDPVWYRNIRIKDLSAE
jgi:hypothetical protein